MPTPRTDAENKRTAWPSFYYDFARELEVETQKLSLENTRLKEALDRIARPVWWMAEDLRRETGSINGLDGRAAHALANDAAFLREVAKEALKIIDHEPETKQEAR